MLSVGRKSKQGISVDTVTRNLLESRRIILVWVFSMKLKAEDIVGLWLQIEDELGAELTFESPGWGYGICLKARGAQALASLARPQGKKIPFNPTVRILQQVEEESDFDEIVVFPYAIAALCHHIWGFGVGDSGIVKIIRNPDHRSITIEAGPTSFPFRLSCPYGMVVFPYTEIQEHLFEKPAAWSFVLRRAEMAIGGGFIPRRAAIVLPMHHRVLLSGGGPYFSFGIPQHLLKLNLSAFAFQFPKYSGWAAPSSIKIDVKDKTARLEQSGLRAYCEIRPIEDRLYELNITGQPMGFLRVRAIDVEPQLRRFDQGWVSISLSEGSAEAILEDKESDEESMVIGAFGGYNGLTCKMKIAIRNLRTALNAGFCDFEVRRALPEYSYGLYLLGKARFPQTDPRLSEGERRKHPTEVEVFILTARHGFGPIESKTPGKEATT